MSKSNLINCLECEYYFKILKTDNSANGGGNSYYRDACKKLGKPPHQASAKFPTPGNYCRYFKQKNK